MSVGKAVVRSFLLLVTLCMAGLCMAGAACAQQGSLKDTLQEITKDAQGAVGVAILYPETGDRLELRGGEHFPMQSVFKFPLAIKILHDVDSGRFTLDMKIHVEEKDWVQGMYSPLRDHYNGRAVDIPLREVLEYTVSVSDNNGCDLLFKLAGGPAAVDRYIHGLGIRAISIVATEAEMHAAWDVQYRNWCTPGAMADLLQLFLDGRILSAGNTQLLRHWMTPANKPNRIMGLLPPGTPVAHKPGTSDTNEQGLTAATNDVGIITLPGGRSLILVVYVSEALADEKTREGVIARIAAAAWAHYAGGR